MSIRIVRLGSPRRPGEGTRLGTVRHPPRGVRREDYSKKNYLDIWVPELAPSSRLGSSDFSFGCYCEDEHHCHRSVLRELLEEAGATIA